MFNLQGSEIIVILLLALVVLGPEKLPDAIRKFTQTYNDFKKMSSGFQTELKSALDEPMREMRETANLMRDAADPSKIVAEAEAEQRLRDEASEATDTAETDSATDDETTTETSAPASAAMSVPVADSTDQQRDNSDAADAEENGDGEQRGDGETEQHDAAERPAP